MYGIRYASSTHAIYNCIPIFTTVIPDTFQMKLVTFFLLSAQNFDSGYSFSCFERGSNTPFLEEK